MEKWFRISLFHHGQDCIICCVAKIIWYSRGCPSLSVAGMFSDCHTGQMNSHCMLNTSWKYKKTWKYLQYVFRVSSSTTSGLSLLFDLPILILSSPPHHQIHFGTEHLLLAPLRSARLPKTHTNQEQFRCNDTRGKQGKHTIVFAFDGGNKSGSG